QFADNLNQHDRAILFDPQTSGGLFAAIDPTLWPVLSAQQEVPFWLIGEVTEQVSEQQQVRLVVR
ncbi:MAG TPA: selenide, water dikinase SelD, partial [Ktedonobacteraceae bacterium]